MSVFLVTEGVPTDYSEGISCIYMIDVKQQILFFIYFEKKKKTRCLLQCVVFAKKEFSLQPVWYFKVPIFPKRFTNKFLYLVNSRKINIKIFLPIL